MRKLLYRTLQCLLILAVTGGLTWWAMGQDFHRGYGPAIGSGGTPAAHAPSHQDGGADEVATTTPAAAAIPKADGSGSLVDWVPAATTLVAGKVERATLAEVDAEADTTRYITSYTLANTSQTFTPAYHANSHTDGTDDIQDSTTLEKGLATTAQITDLTANTVHRTSDGSDHTFMDQSVIIGSSPTLDGANITNIVLPASLNLPKTTATDGQLTQLAVRLLHTYGTENFFAGNSAGNFTLTGTFNVGIGKSGLSLLTSGSRNTTLGYWAGFDASGASDNVFLGYAAGVNITGASHSVVIGSSSGMQLTGNGFDVFVGSGAGRYTGGDNNVYLGYTAGAGGSNPALGAQNVAVGTESFLNHTNSSQNTLIGYQAGKSITTGNGNVCIGYMAGETNLTTQGNKLYIDNTNTATPLILGDFSSRELTFEGSVTLAGLPTNGFVKTRGGTGLLEVAPTVDATEVDIAEIGSATYDDLQDAITVFFSAGLMNPGTGVVSDGGGETVDVAALQGAIRSTDSHVGAYFMFDYAGVAGLNIPTDTTRYVGMDYNSGSPTATVKSTDTWNEHTGFALAVVVNESGTLHITNNPHYVANGISHLLHRLYETEPIKRADRVGGLILGETGTRNLTLSAGEIYDRVNEFDVAAIDTSGADTFDSYSSAGLEFSGSSAWNNTVYDNSGTLTVLGANKWASHWWYVELDGDLVLVYGTVQHNSSAAASLEFVPTTLPGRLTTTGLLVAHAIFQKSAGTYDSIGSAFAASFTPAQASDHTNLSNVGTLIHTEIDTFIPTSMAVGGVLYASASDAADAMDAGSIGYVVTSAGAGNAASMQSLPIADIRVNSMMNGLRLLTDQNLTGRQNLNQVLDEFASADLIDAGSSDALYNASTDSYSTPYVVEEEFTVTTDDNYTAAFLTLGNGGISYVDNVGMSFTLQTGRSVKRIQMYMKKAGTPGDIRLDIMTDNAGPSTTLAHANLTTTVTEATVLGTAGWVSATFPSAGALSANTTYWLVMTLVGDPGGGNLYYHYGDKDDTYPDGFFQHHVNGGAWAPYASADPVDAAFKIEYTAATAVLYSTSFTATEVPRDAVFISWANPGAGSTTYTMSRDGGTTYTALPANLIAVESGSVSSYWGQARLTAQPSGQTMVMKATINGDATLYGWAFDYNN